MAATAGLAADRGAGLRWPIGGGWLAGRAVPPSG